MEHGPIQGSRRAISHVISRPQYVELAGNAKEMRPALIDCKTYSDHVDAYAREALGSDEG